MLEISGLQAGYGATRVVHGVDLSVPSGQVVGLVGPNAGGKTTALRAISGVIERRAGTVTLDGVMLPASPSSVAGHGLAHVPEGRGLFARMTVEQNLKIGAVAVGKPWDDEQLERINDIFPALKRLMSRTAGLLSGGEQQMVSIARGLAARPRYLMIDELSLGLAPRIVLELMNVLGDVAHSGVGLLVVDQNVRALATICTTMYSLKDGRSRVQQDPSSDQYLSVYFS
jgi:branched-chain amino acid transport system ATP-binding protein